MARRVKGATEQFVDEALATLAGIELFEAADEDHDIAAVGQGFFDQRSAGAAGRVIVDANKAKAVALRSVRIVSDQVGVSGGLVEQIGLIVRVNGAYGHAVDAAGQQGLDDALLVGDPFAGHLHLSVGGKFGGRGFHSFGGNGPKGTNAIGDESDLGLGHRLRLIATATGNKNQGKEQKGHFHSLSR